jgi:hypothetical protein
MNKLFPHFQRANGERERERERERGRSEGVGEGRRPKKPQKDDISENVTRVNEVGSSKKPQKDEIYEKMTRVRGNRELLRSHKR